MNFDYIHLHSFLFLRISYHLPKFSHKLSIILHIFLFLKHKLWSPFGAAKSMVSLPGATSLKKTGLSSPPCHQLSIAPQLGVETSDLLSASCWKVNSLHFAGPLSAQLLWAPRYRRPVVCYPSWVLGAGVVCRSYWWVGIHSHVFSAL